MKNKVLIIIYLCFFWISYSQKKTSFRVRTIAFYNVENLFDTISQENVLDEERTPMGKYGWNQKRYYKKLSNLSKIISRISYRKDQIGPDILGLCEVENRMVIEDLVQQEPLVRQSYKIVHKNSPDARGIDVALVYKEGVFVPENILSHKLTLQGEDGYYKPTRNQLVVSGYMDSNPIAFVVNHWPSRSGGVTLTKKYRHKAAELNRKIIDSLQRYKPNLKIVNMGDFNDNPNDFSIKKILRTTKDKSADNPYFMYNPMENLYKKGMGSLAFKDKWYLFDQIMVNHNMLQSDGIHLRYWKVGIFQPKILKNQKGRYQNYPYRTYNGSVYAGGYSDHFPVFIHLIQPIQREP